MLLFQRRKHYNFIRDTIHPLSNIKAKMALRFFCRKYLRIKEQFKNSLTEICDSIYFNASYKQNVSRPNLTQFR